MKQANKIPYFYAVVCTAVYLTLIFSNNVWLDEAFSASIIRSGFGEMATKTFADTLPPFYNFAAWGFTRAFGFSTVTLKLFSVIPMSLLMFTAAHYIPKISSAKAACLYILLITAMPHFLEYGVEIRMYSWAVFFASASAIFALCLLQGIDHTRLPLVICTILGAYTHQFALIAEAFVWLMLLMIFIKKKRFLHILPYAAVCIILYIPCAVLTVFQMKSATSYFSATSPTIASLMASVRFPFVTDKTVISAALLVLVVTVFVFGILRREYISVYYISLYGLVTILSFGLMWITGSSFFSSRYLLPSMGILWIGVALITDKAAGLKRTVSIVAVTAVAVVFAVIYTGRFQAEYTDMSAFEQFIGSTTEDDGYVIFEDFPEIELCMEYYAPWLKAYKPDEIQQAEGEKYLIVNGDVHMDDLKKIDPEKFEIKYIEDLSFDRYTFRIYILLAKEKE